jgi:hypothetical protein
MLARARLRALLTDSTVRVQHIGHLVGVESEDVAQDKDGELARWQELKAGHEGQGDGFGLLVTGPGGRLLANKSGGITLRATEEALGNDMGTVAGDAGKQTHPRIITLEEMLTWRSSWLPTSERDDGSRGPRTGDYVRRTAQVRQITRARVFVTIMRKLV